MRRREKATAATEEEEEEEDDDVADEAGGESMGDEEEEEEGREGVQDEESEEELQGRMSYKEKKKKKKRGVVYLGRPPPFMKPVKVRFLLEQYGRVTNLFLQPEDATVRKSRTKRGGSSKVKYVEGWVEFADRKVAKAVAVTLNGKRIGGNRRNFHYEDLWNIKYLPGFQWHHLVEKANYERNAQKARLRAELAQTKRETDYFLEKVAQGRKIKAIIKRKEGKGKAADASAGAKRQFKQLDTLDAYKNKRAKRAEGSDDWLSQVMS